MKFLYILLFLLMLFGLIALYFRKHIQTALYMWQMFRKMRQISKPKTEKRIEKTEPASAAKLVKCTKCGTWTPLTKAIYFRSKIFYCSKNCMETVVVK